METLENTEKDNQLRRRAEKTADIGAQEQFNYYVERIAFCEHKSIEEVLALAMVKEYGKSLGVEYTGGNDER